MQTQPSQRTWLSPLTGVAFLAIAITGLLMFFHVRLPGMTFLHELGGLLFVVVAVLHLKLNWRPLIACCRQRRGRIALVAAGVLAALILGLGIGHDDGHGRHRGTSVEGGVTHEPRR